MNVFQNFCCNTFLIHVKEERLIGENAFQRNTMRIKCAVCVMELVKHVEPNEKEM